MATHNDRESDPTIDRESLLYWLRVVVYSLAAVLGVALLTIGTVAIIAELKGSWHWQIHLDSTVRYVGLFVQYLLWALVPLFGLLVVARWRWSDA